MCGVVRCRFFLLTCLDSGYDSSCSYDGFLSAIFFESSNFVLFCHHALSHHDLLPSCPYPLSPAPFLFFHAPMSFVGLSHPVLAANVFPFQSLHLVIFSKTGNISKMFRSFCIVVDETIQTCLGDILELD